jgi:hypothetical protein
MQGEAGDIGFVAGAGHGAVHRLDDVAADRQVPQGLLGAGLQGPARGADLLGKSEPFEFRSTAKHQAAQFRVFISAAWSQVGDATFLVGKVL